MHGHKIIMTFDERLRAYAHLIANSGIHIQKGQEVVLRCPVECYSFARLLVEESYKAGAHDVIVMWDDALTSRIRYEYAELPVFERYPQWKADSLLQYARTGAAFISISGTDPEVFKGVDAGKQRLAMKATNAALKEYYDLMTRGEIKWNVSAVPTMNWAKKVFSDCSEQEAMSRLWDAIFKAVRIGEGDPVALWEEHASKLSDKCKFLNDKQFVKLHYKNSLGTDFMVGLVKNHRWEGGADVFKDGSHYFANMPTEEVFTMPHRLQAEGTLVSALPLSYQGNLICDFSLTFKNGRVEDFTAKEGYESLKLLLDTDEGSRHLGEVALVPLPSPVAEQEILFYNTLFDENASCHFALGECYSTNIIGGSELQKEELNSLGGNTSDNHVDFMVGTKDLDITGYTSDGESFVVFQSGSWAF